jgi:hypothetical protein
MYKEIFAFKSGLKRTVYIGFHKKINCFKLGELLLAN